MDTEDSASATSLENAVPHSLYAAADQLDANASAKKSTPRKGRRRRKKSPRVAASPSKLGWRVAEWCPDVGVSRAYFYASIIHEVETMKLGSMLIILTSPKDYIARKKAQQAQAAD